MITRRHTSGTLLAAALAILTAGGAFAALPPGQGLLLPVLDRADESGIAGMIYDVLDLRVSNARPMLDPEGLRARMRQQRIRSIDQASPERVAALTEALGIDWLLSTTLHEAVLEPIPYVTISAKLYVIGSTDLAWAGFVSMTGQDAVTWLGLGFTSSAQDLARLATIRLTEDLLDNGDRPVSRPRFIKDNRGFSAKGSLPEPNEKIAVVPFNSVTGSDALVTAEILTASSLAALHEAGYEIISPGYVTELLREQGRLLFGETDRLAQTGLRVDLLTDWVLTGTVETYRPGSGLTPDPWIAVSARLVSTETGRIVWFDGQERHGSDSDGVFELGRVHAAGGLAYEIMRSLVAGFSKER